MQLIEFIRALDPNAECTIDELGFVCPEIKGDEVCLQLIFTCEKNPVINGLILPISHPALFGWYDFAVESLEIIDTNLIKIIFEGYCD